MTNPFRHCPSDVETASRLMRAPIECDFMILTLPRCRSAWLSQFFTSSGAFCWHDLMPMHSLDEVRTLLAGTPGPAGVADTSLYLHPSALRPKRVAYVVRPAADSARSLAAVAPAVSEDYQREIIETMHDEMKKCMQAHPGPVVVLKELRDLEASLPRMWAHLLPGVPFPHLRLKQLRNLKVEILPEVLRAACNGTLPPSHLPL